MRNWIKSLTGGQTPKKTVESEQGKVAEEIEGKDIIAGIETDLAFIKSRLAPRGEDSSFRSKDGQLVKMNLGRENINRILTRILDGKLNVHGSLFLDGNDEGSKATDSYSKWFAEQTEVPLIWCYNNTVLKTTGRAYQFVDPARVRPEKVLLYPFLPQELKGSESDGNPDDELKSLAKVAKVMNTNVFQSAPGTDEWRIEIAEKAKKESASEEELLEYADGYTLGVISAIFKRLTPDSQSSQFEKLLRKINQPKN